MDEQNKNLSQNAPHDTPIITMPDVGDFEVKTLVDASKPNTSDLQHSSKAKTRKKIDWQQGHQKLKKAISEISFNKEEERKEEKAIARPSGISFESVESGSVARSCKRVCIPGDAPETLCKKPCMDKTFNHILCSSITLRIGSKNYAWKLTTKDFQHINSRSEDLMLEDTGGIYPKVIQTSLNSEGLIIVCKDQGTVDWFEKIINQLKPPEELKGHPGYLALGPCDLPPMKNFYVWFPGDRDPDKSIRLLEVCNSGIESRKLHIKTIIPRSGGKALILGVESDLLPILEANNHILFCGMGTVMFCTPGSSPKKRWCRRAYAGCR